MAPYTSPVPGFEWLPRARSRYLTKLARLLLTADGLPGWLASAMDGVRPRLTELLRDEPATLLGALALPVIGAPLAAGRLDLAVPNLLLELARRKKLGREGAWWPAPVAALGSPATGLGARFDPPLVGVLFSDAGVEVAAGIGWDTAASPAYFPMAQGGWLATVDTNPLSNVEAHPDKHGNAVDLGGRGVNEWLTALDAARALIRTHLPALAAEHAQVLAGVVPVGFEPEKSLSASYFEAIGQVYVSLHPQTVVMAEALIHETQHNKLNLLLWSDPLLEEDGALHVSPVRPDPRPLRGVLLAAHAFLPVADLHRALIAARHPLADPERLASVERVNSEALDVLAAARPTAIGKVLFDGMRRPRSA